MSSGAPSPPWRPPLLAPAGLGLLRMPPLFCCFPALLAPAVAGTDRLCSSQHPHSNPLWWGQSAPGPGPQTTSGAPNSAPAAL